MPHAPTLEKIENGLYLDFEGFGGQYKPDPILCGYRIGGHGPVKQVVFTQAYKATAISADSGSHVEYNPDCTGFLRNLVSVDGAGRKLFIFSQHETDVIERILKIRVQTRRADVHKFAKQAFPQVDRPRTLIKYCQEAGIDVPADYGRREVTEKFKLVREWSGSDSKWNDAPEEVKKAWRSILKHNQFDVTSMYELMIRIKED